MQIYDPIGIFDVTQLTADNLLADFGVILPAEFEKNSDKKGKSYVLRVKKSIDISNGGNNGIFIALRIENKKGKEINKFRNSDYLTVNSIKVDMPIQNFNASKLISHIIVYHDNDFDENSEKEVIELARKFVRDHDYNTEERFRYSKPSGGEKFQPETAGGGILVGTGG